MLGLFDAAPVSFHGIIPKEKVSTKKDCPWCIIPGGGIFVMFRGQLGGGELLFSLLLRKISSIIEKGSGTLL